jgi:phosphoribosylaminoimidazole-succinocarboxamide synthase
MIDDGYIDYLINAKGAREYALMRQVNPQVFLLLEKAFARFKIQLVDIKLEYGIIGGGLYLIDEVTGGSFRLWPYAHDNPNLEQTNVLEELDPGGRLDKDTYRMGEKVQTVKSKFAQIAGITAKFRELQL